MTILCLALGNPTPTISLYVGGHLVRQETSRHMVTVIHNVTTDMSTVSCFADNGYGVPMQASKKINISCKCDGFWVFKFNFLKLLIFILYSRPKNSGWWNSSCIHRRNG